MVGLRILQCGRSPTRLGSAPIKRAGDRGTNTEHTLNTGTTRPGSSRPAIAETLKSRRTMLASVGLTLVMAWPIVLSPSTEIFGSEIVGRHHDPFTVMQQFESGGATGPYLQPATDLLGIALARTISPIAAFNVLVLLTFPLTALATYLLASYTFGSGLGASVAALLFTFAPVRLAHAAYHVHIVQTQWLPLYLLALWALVDRSTWTRAFLLAAATIFLVLSNWYGALIGAVVSPVALLAYGLAAPDRAWSRRMLIRRRRWALAVAGLSAGVALLPVVWTHPERYAFPISSLTLYGARWWSYLVPPVDHPLVGAIARRWWDRTDIGPGLLEQQLSLGWSVPRPPPPPRRGAGGVAGSPIGRREWFRC